MENLLHIRLNGNRSDIKNTRTEKPVAAHFNLVGHSIDDLTIMVIEKINRNDASHRKKKESYWIKTLRSMAPEGFMIYEKDGLGNIRNHMEGKTGFYGQLTIQFKLKLHPTVQSLF